MVESRSNLLRGTLDLLILKTLSTEPMHGYRIAGTIQQLSDEVLRIEEGSLYPALYRLEQKGFIESEWGMTDTKRKAKFYKLTRAGQKQLQLEEESWDRLVLVVAKMREAT